MASSVFYGSCSWLYDGKSHSHSCDGRHHENLITLIDSHGRAAAWRTGLDWTGLHWNGKYYNLMFQGSLFTSASGGEQGGWAHARHQDHRQEGPQGEGGLP